jgi:hypothetical protein
MKYLNFKFLLAPFFLLLLLSGIEAFADDGATEQEQAFIQGRLALLNTDESGDQAELASAEKSLASFPSLLNDARMVARDFVLYIEAHVAVEAYAMIDVTAETAFEVTDAIKYPKLAHMAKSMSASRFTKALELDPEKAEKKAIVLAAKNLLDEQKAAQASFGNQVSSAENRLAIHQQSFSRYLSARSDIEEKFEKKFKELEANTTSVLSDGNETADFLELNLVRINALIGLDHIEQGYFEQVEK